MPRDSYSTESNNSVTMAKVVTLTQKNITFTFLGILSCISIMSISQIAHLALLDRRAQGEHAPFANVLEPAPPRYDVDIWARDFRNDVKLRKMQQEVRRSQLG